MTAGLQRLVQDDVSAGMFPALAPDHIPRNGVFDITNGLLDEAADVYRRGGTTHLCSAPAGSPRLLWSGFLKNGGFQVILAAGGETFRVKGGALESLGFEISPGVSRGQVFEGLLYFKGGKTFDGTTASVVAGEGAAKQYYATAANRVLGASGTRVNFSNVPQIGDGKGGELGILKWGATDYHELPGGVNIIGMEGWRNSCVVFTTEGIWVIGGLQHDLTDAEGNIQQTLDRYSGTAILWGDAGVAAWEGGLVVPCRDTVRLMELGVSSERAAPFVPIGGAIESVYQAYVGAGRRPGPAAVFRGHYFLPILELDTLNLIDVFVCALNGRDQEGRRVYAWSHLAGYGGQVSMFSSTQEAANEFIAATPAGRVLNTASYFAPSATTAKDADGSDYPFSITYRDIATGNLRPNLVTKARLRYRMSAPLSSRLRMSFGQTLYGGAEWGEFDWGEADWNSPTGPFTTLSGEAPPDPAATSPYPWRVGKKVRFARVKVELVGPANALSLRSLELFVRADGKLF